MWDNNKFWITSMAFIKVSSLEKDKFGVKLKFPNRSCDSCKKYPCFSEIKKCSSNFAAYGCIYYEELGNDSSSKASS